jgi:hypothetical protein
MEPTGAEAWPWYYGLLALFGGLIVSLVVSSIIAAIWIVAGGNVHDSGLIVVGTAIQSVIFIGTVWFLASLRGKATTREFGLLRAPFWPTVGKMAGVMVTYLILLAIYSSLVHISSDDTPDKLGANAGILGMLFFGIMVAVLAPISEEIFFRGMIFRSFANGMGVWGGAIVSGLCFGALHIDSFASSRLLQVVPLAVLGIMFALLYAWSGTLYSTIALHCTNNSLAVIVYANDHHSTFGVVLAIVLWLSMMVACATGWKLTDRGGDEGPKPELPAPPYAPQPTFAPPGHPQPQTFNPPQPDRPDFPWGQP